MQHSKRHSIEAVSYHGEPRRVSHKKNKTLSAIAAIVMAVSGQTAMADSRTPLPADHSITMQPGGQVTLQLDVPAGENRQVLSYATVTLVDRHGAARKFQADNHGIVQLTGVSAEPYAVIASNGNAYGSTLFVVRQAQSGAVASTPAKMTLAHVNSNKLMPWMDQYVKQFSQKSPGQLGSVADEVPSSSVTAGHRIQLSEGGVLKGNLVSVLSYDAVNSDLRGTEVVLMQKGIAVGKAYAEPNGDFEFRGVRGGAHGIVAAGPAGYATLAFEAVDASDVAMKRDSDHQFVSVMSKDTSSLLPIVMVPPAMIPGVIDPFGVSVLSDEETNKATELTAAPGQGTGIFSGGGGIGGGGIGGGGIGGGAGAGAGGLGGLGALGALGAAIAIPAATSGSDNDSPGSIASPSGF